MEFMCIGQKRSSYILFLNVRKPETGNFFHCFRNGDDCYWWWLERPRCTQRLSDIYFPFVMFWSCFESFLRKKPSDTKNRTTKTNEFDRGIHGFCTRQSRGKNSQTSFFLVMLFQTCQKNDVAWLRQQP